MNIEEAKNYIKNTVKLYLKKDEYGEYKLPIERQRPIFLLGAPGIGKTAVMEQIAAELGIALVSYSMSHHTRQSALGLPFIKHEKYGDMEYDVSEYTMSEIIASIYETMRESGITEGVLFLDEINCVSETLAPSMLQFLQYKTFGRHSVPAGWIIVTAGNPPEYNKSVREFDVVTLDRLKVMEVSADYETWKNYALEKGVHSAIISFLDINKDYFYYMETTTKGRFYITARGWEDLSDILKLYEEDGIKADEALIGQYIRNDNVVKEFGTYYDLFNKYKKDYKIEELLDNEPQADIVEKAKKAAFDERLSLLGMLLDNVLIDIRASVEMLDYLNELKPILQEIKEADNIRNNKINILEAQLDNRKIILDKKKKANTLTMETKLRQNRIIEFIRNLIDDIGSIDPAKENIDILEMYNREIVVRIKKNYDSELDKLKSQVEKTSRRLHNLFSFSDTAFSDGNEMLILVTELTVGKASSRYISTFGCEDYDLYNSKLMLSDRKNDINKKLNNLL
ncbi:MAG: AAA family ATPase [Lachnospiraceae bacterium]|nr:AAA family ATPase [Lachnospiraceae bacterium]